MACLAIEADEFKLYQVLDKFSQRYGASYSLIRDDGKFTLRVKTDDFGELIRRLNLIKGCKYQIQEMIGSPTVSGAKADFTRTNIDALIGRRTVAMTDISPIDGGLVKIIGEQWFSRPINDRTIRKGAQVRVIRVEGVSLMVEEVEEDMDDS